MALLQNTVLIREKTANVLCSLSAKTILRFIWGTFRGRKTSLTKNPVRFDFEIICLSPQQNKEDDMWFFESILHTYNGSRSVHYNDLELR